jgi:hypothetical protein
MTKIFFDTEFTGLHKLTTLISIGLVNPFGDQFYAELIDYDQSQINPWLQENVLDKLKLGGRPAGVVEHETDELSLCRRTTIRGNKAEVAAALTEWLTQSETHLTPVQMWSDCLAYDWVLFNDLMADYTNGYPQLPQGIHYIPMDICPLFELKGIDPDISREAFSEMRAAEVDKHNALYDAQVISRCYYKLTD